MRKYSGNRYTIPARGPVRLWSDQTFPVREDWPRAHCRRKGDERLKRCDTKHIKIRYKTNLPLLVIDVYALWNIFEYYAELSEQTPRCCSRSHSLEFCYKIVGAHFCVKEGTFAFSLWTMSLLFFTSLLFASQWSFVRLEEARPSHLIPTGKRVHGWQNSLPKQ